MNKVSKVDPRELFRRLVDELPAFVTERVFVVGSLAAASHYVDQRGSPSISMTGDTVCRASNSSP